MGAYGCWLQVRERLRENLNQSSDAASAAYLTRHTLAQVEQNTMAEQPDDPLRQQTGILFSCFKASLSLLDISVTTKVWIAQGAAENKPLRPQRWLLLGAASVATGVALYGYAKGLWLVWGGVAVALLLGVAGLLAANHAHRQVPPTEDRIRVTAKPDTEKLFAAIDAQMKAIDRYTNDFAYLNEQTALRDPGQGGKHTQALAALMDAVASCEGEAGEEVTDAASRLLQSMGIAARSYRPEDRRLFTVLPSLSGTHTLVPALVSAKDGTLLHRGTAAVPTLDIPLPNAPASAISEDSTISQLRRLP